ncbi:MULTISPECIES: SDR family NAD(P)-dependent oxidoreductase [Subtercola]|uniref:Probable oxidoreductase n=1 Tax=Subtercola vilae TaxID=2056433 RepID=A0A4T2C5X4_9MICO|nr:MULTISPECIES: SDR family NAD(P)-dependent oxidoreductase [Subtercola]MEA9985145.1 SDR family NAD(P)-dependent oxidoreductase [Subtercola sp. RTI3]TIH37658.1 SDR family NAD(P)-dependent oxidoreductase [Subtercola vilae]
MTDRIITPFGAESTASDVIAGIDLTGKRVIVTGGSSGLGRETSRALASAGALVTLAVRNVEAARAVADSVSASTGTQVEVRELDLSDQHSVSRFVAGWVGPLDILVNNAGVMALPELRQSADRWEMQFATNHLGHFALASGLHRGLAAAGNARVVSVSSVGHIDGKIDFDDLMFERRPYNEWAAYGQSKTANILFAVEASKRWAADGITANALNPGRIPTTGLMRHLPSTPPSVAPGIASSTGVSMKTIEQGAATTVFLASSPLLDGIGGRYFEDCNEAVALVPGVRRGFADYALDPAEAARLWAASDALIADRLVRSVAPSADSR